jgi:4-amino-4-deoxy-L-arabinose transferase-like glycosyltransferase
MTRRTLFLVPLLCAPVFLIGLGASGLAEPDEGRNAEVGREMLETGDYVTPHLNAAVYLDKPPVFFWAVAASVAAFGANETAARLPSALSAVAGIALTVWFARRWFGERVAWLAGALLATMPLYVVFARLVIFDMMLLVFTALSTLLFFEAMESEGPRPWLAILGFAAAAAGTITKGPVALVVPLLVALVWALLSRRPGLLKRLRFGTGLLVYLALVAPWALLVESRNPGFLSYALLGENLARMTANPYETTRPFHFYARVLAPGLFPWIVLVIVEGIAMLARRLRGTPAAEPAPDARAARFVAVWLGVLVVFFSAISSKRPSYVLPCALPVAILAARLIVRGAATEPSRARRAAGAVMCAVATLLLAGVAVVKPQTLALPPPLLYATGAALVVAAVLLLAVRRSASPGLFAAAAALPLLALLPLAAVATRQIETERSSREVSRWLAARLGPEDRVVCFEEFRPGLNYYLRRPIQQVTRAGRVFTSNYIAAHLDTLKKTDGFRLMTPDDFKTALGDSRVTYVLAPEKEYGPLLGMAGRPLERVWESGHFGLFVPDGRAAATGNP